MNIICFYRISPGKRSISVSNSSRASRPSWCVIILSYNHEICNFDKIFMYRTSIQIYPICVSATRSTAVTSLVRRTLQRGTKSMINSNDNSNVSIVSTPSPRHQLTFVTFFCTTKDLAFSREIEASSIVRSDRSGRVADSLESLRRIWLDATAMGGSN